jgi:hypothetical protein
VLAKAEAKEGPATTATITTPTHTTANKEEGSIVDEHKEEETVKAEPRSAPSYMTRELDKENNNDLNNPNPFVAGTDDILVECLWRIP